VNKEGCVFQSGGRRRRRTTRATKNADKDKEEENIDYTDFQFEQPQEFCTSICDDLNSNSSTGSSRTTDKDIVLGGKGLPLSAWGLMHWTEALVLPKYDPQVMLVDLFKVCNIFYPHSSFLSGLLGLNE
jgi:hypothetical protein